MGTRKRGVYGWERTGHTWPRCARFVFSNVSKHAFNFFLLGMQTGLLMLERKLASGKLGFLLWSNWDAAIVWAESAWRLDRRIMEEGRGIPDTAGLSS